MKENKSGKIKCRASDRCSGNHIEDQLFEQTIVLEEIEPGLFTSFEDTTAIQDKKSLTVFLL